MTKLAELRKTAKGMGISPAVLRGATTASALEKVIADHAEHDKPRAKKKASNSTRTVAKKKLTKAAQARKSSGRKASAPAKSSRATKAKRPSNSNGSGYVPKGGRNLLGKVNFSQTDGWNARKGSAPDRIIAALRKCKGNRTKAFEQLQGDVWDFVAKKKQNGEKRTKAEALAMLKYRIHRTLFDFARQTGQHEPATNRVQYGTGGTGQGVWKPAKKSAQKASKAPARKASKNTGRTPAKAQKRSQGRTAGRKGGRAKAGSRR